MKDENFDIPVEHMSDTRQYKMDILFYRAYQILKRNYFIAIVYYIVKVLILTVFLPIDLITIKAQPSFITIFMGLGLAASIYNSIVFIIYYTCILTNVQKALQYAIQINHAMRQQQGGDEGYVSKTMYNNQNQVKIDSEGLNEQIRNSLEQFMQNSLNRLYLNKYPAAQGFISLGKFFGFSVFIIGIVSLSITPANTAQLVVLIIYLVLEGITHIFIFVVIIIIGLVPILCVLICCCMCCCGDRGQINLPQPVKVTMQMIGKGDSNCPICFQSFNLNQDIVILKCSQLHRFHSTCIKGWVNISPTCPNCRQRI